MPQDTYDLRQPLPIGTKVGLYTIKSFLSKGGSCLTYLAEKCNGTTYVIKEGYLPIEGLCRNGFAVYSKNATINKWVGNEIKQIFYAEINNANKARKLKGNNSERVFEHEDITDEVISNEEFKNTVCRYIAIDTSYGKTLSDIAKSSELTLKEKLTLIREAAISLNELLHKKQFVHADVTPDNLFFPLEFQPKNTFCKLIDFGSFIDLKDINAQMRFTNSDKYSSPEILRCEWELIGTHSDIYSLAITLLVLIVGKNEFFENYDKIINRIDKNDKTGLMPYISNKYEYLTASLTSLLQKSVSFNTVARPTTKEFINALGSLIEIIDQKGFHPEVLLQGISKKYHKDIKPQDDEANPELFAHTTEQKRQSANLF